ncbi:hypothetical protein BJ912DRAFT_925101 [Pholiota molesta]|nr:hypothetical protein BJ912DRAFT_925101 [Pholiota molesta]
MLVLALLHAHCSPLVVLASLPTLILVVGRRPLCPSCSSMLAAAVLALAVRRLSCSIRGRDPSSVDPRARLSSVWPLPIVLPAFLLGVPLRSWCILLPLRWLARLPSVWWLVWLLVVWAACAHPQPSRLCAYSLHRVAPADVGGCEVANGGCTAHARKTPMRARWSRPAPAPVGLQSVPDGWALPVSPQPFRALALAVLPQPFAPTRPSAQPTSGQLIPTICRHPLRGSRRLASAGIEHKPAHIPHWRGGARSKWRTGEGAQQGGGGGGGSRQVGGVIEGWWWRRRGEEGVVESEINQDLVDFAFKRSLK